MNRASTLSKIRALLSKTIENGCTQEEALLALAKAKAMMDAYEVTKEDLAEAQAESAIIFDTKKDDPQNIRFDLCKGVAKFTDTRAWRHGGSVVFCGLRPDVEFATWLLDHLSDFVMEELVDHLMTLGPKAHQRKDAMDAFAGACCKRIIERLKAIIEAARPTTNANALVVVKTGLIRAEMARAGVHLSSAPILRQSNGLSESAGRAAGDRATFGRPVEGGGPLRLEKR